MWTREFVRSQKYDAVLRTVDPIELFKHVVVVTFDTEHDTESRYVNYTECTAKAQGG